MALIQYLTRIQFGVGALALLPDELTNARISRALLVSDRGLEACGIVDRIRDLGARAIVGTYCDTPSHPNEASLLEALQLYRELGCDGVVALGGGSPIDLGKAVALLDSHGGCFADYGVLTGGSARIGKIRPVVAIPTAAGTGAEVGRAIVLTLSNGRVVVAVSMNNIPAAVICDPELTLSLPARLSAATGIDALSHGLEAYLSKVDNPIAALLALDCLRRCGRSLPRVVESGSDLAAREDMLMAALQGGMVLQKSLGAIHAMSNPLGELGMHHGEINAVLMPHVLRFNADAAKDKMKEVKTALGLSHGADLAEWSSEFVRCLGLPQRLSALGAESLDVEQIAEAAERDHLSATNPRSATKEDYAAMLRAAF